MKYKLFVKVIESILFCSSKLFVIWVLFDIVMNLVYIKGYFVDYFDVLEI